MSSAYLRLLIFLQAVLITVCASSSPSFHIMYSAYKLNKSRMAIHSLDGLLSQFGASPLFHVRFCCFFDLHTGGRRQEAGGRRQETGKVIWYSHFFKNFPQFVVIHTVQGFRVVNETEVDVFMEFSCSFYDPVDVGDLISGSSAFSKSNLNIWNFCVHVELKPEVK